MSNTAQKCLSPKQPFCTALRLLFISVYGSHTHHTEVSVSLNEFWNIPMYILVCIIYFPLHFPHFCYDQDSISLIFVMIKIQSHWYFILFLIAIILKTHFNFRLPLPWCNRYIWAKLITIFHWILIRHPQTRLYSSFGTSVTREIGREYRHPAPCRSQ